MITRDSRLIPSQVKAQSESAITALEADNEHLCSSITAANAFISDSTNRAESFDRLRLKMEDYVRVANALILANESDVADHQKLIASVGASDGDLIGWQLIEGRARNDLDRITANNRAINYRRIRDELLAGRTVISGIPHRIEQQSVREIWTVWAQNGESYQIGLRDIAAGIVQDYDDKKALYESIENETKGLFACGVPLRSEAVRGLDVIHGASSGLPDSYNNGVLDAWRDSIEFRNDRLLDNLINELFDGFFDENGEPLTEEIEWFLINNAIDGFPRWQWEAMTRLFGGDRLDHQQVVDIFSAANLQAGFMDNAHVFAIHSIIEELSSRVSRAFMSNVDDFLFNGGDEGQLINMMRRSQLFTFMGALDPGSLAAHHFGNLGDLNTDNVLIYRGNPFVLSCPQGLLHGNPNQTLAQDLAAILVRMAENDSEILDAIKYASRFAFDASGFIPVWSQVVTAMSTMSSGIDLLMFLVSGNPALSSAQQTQTLADLHAVVSGLGGRIVYVGTPDGNGIAYVGTTFMTSNAIVNFAGLCSVHGILPGNVVPVLLDINHADHEAVNSFFNAHNECAVNFREELQNVGQEHFGNNTVITDRPPHEVYEIIGLMQ